MADEMAEYDVAVVVFARVRAVDAGDAEDRAMVTVRQALADRSGSPVMPMQVQVPCWAQRTATPVTVASVQGIRYCGMSLAIRPTAQPYRHAGLDEPDGPR